MLLNREEVKELIEGVWSGKYNRSKLPQWLFEYTANDLEGAAVRGWGKNLGTGALKDLELERSIQENIYYFAAHKTAQQLQDLHTIFKASTGKYNFVKKALMINEKYNNFWYDTEYNVTMRIARAGREWRRIESLKNLYPKLRFIAVQDANTRKSHAWMHGIIRPVDDPFWKLWFPPLDWNCRCRVERLTQGADSDLSKIQLPEIEQQFKNKVLESGKIWLDSHPYFSGLTTLGKRAAMKLVAEKVVKETPWEFTDPYDVSQNLKANHPDVSFDIRATKIQWDREVKGYNLPRFVRNIADEFAKATDASGKPVGCKLTSVEVKSSEGRLRIHLHGRTDNGRITLHRSYFKDFDSGLKTVEHDYFKIPEEIQGGGFSKRVFQHLYKEYQAAGVQRLYVHANLDVGGYTWSRYGFCMPKGEVRNFIRYQMRYNQSVQDDALLAFENWKLDCPDENLFPMNILTQVPGTKSYLLGSNWYGEIRLTMPERRHYYEDYLYGRNK